jgi:transcriptional antiterminator RfaH
MEITMHWYLIHTKPKQELTALQNLERQGYECYLPLLPVEKIRQGSMTVAREPLFPRYLFIRLGQGGAAKSWVPIRSTRGVSRLVCFGVNPAQIEDGLITFLKMQEDALQLTPVRMFVTGERVAFTQGAFAGLEGIYQMTDGDHRAMVLIELMSRPVTVKIASAELRKAG